MDITATTDRLIGQEIETQCGKCKTATLHTVTAVKDGKISRVMCNVCNGYHVYRNKPAAAKTVRKTTTARKPTTRRGKLDWDSLMSGLEEKQVMDYSTAADFSSVRAIRHKSFGVGIIIKVLTNTKIEVLFQGGSKLMGQNIDSTEVEAPAVSG